MFRHVVALRWIEGTSDADVQAVLDALAELPGRYPELRSYRVGIDAGLDEGNFDVVVVADFDDADAFRRFHQDPYHQRLLVERIKPLVADRAAVQHHWQ